MAWFAQELEEAEPETAAPGCVLKIQDIYGVSLLG